MPQFWHSGMELINVSDPPSPNLAPNILNDVQAWTLSCPVHDLRILWCQKSSRVTSFVGRGIALDIHKVSFKNAWRPRSLSWIIMMKCWQLRVPSNTTSSHLPPWWMAPRTVTEGPSLPSDGWMHASPAPEVSLSVGPAPHAASSPMIQCQAGTPGGRLD